MNPTEASRLLESEVLAILKANPGKKYRTKELAEILTSTTKTMLTICGRLAGKGLITERKGNHRFLYLYQQGAIRGEARAFVQKPYKFDPGMLDRLNQIKAGRVEIPSKTNAEDAGELSEMDRNKLRMMGSGN